MPAPNLRPYQTAGLNLVRQSFASGHDAPILVAPTGSGKTVCAASIIHGAVNKGKRVLFLAHRQELCTQASLKLADCDVAHSVIAQDAVIRQMKVAHFRKLGRSLVDPMALVSIGMVQTVVKRLHKIPVAPDLIIVDECHLSVSSTYKQIIASFPKAKLIGLTATPTRLSGEGMGKHDGGLYDDLIVLCQPQYLIDSGFLVKPRIFTTPNLPDMSSIKTAMGDYAKGELAMAVDKPALVGDAVDHYRKLAHGRPAIVFCVSVAHAEHVAAEFNAAGYRAVAVNGDSDDDDRAGAVAGLGDGTWDVVCNCGLYIEGLDQTAIGCVIDLAPTQSLTRYLQKIGRGLRPHPGKTDCIILDHGGNTARHGLPQIDREWTLDGTRGKKRGKRDDEPDVKVKVCDKCYTVHEPAPSCPTCGYLYPVVSRELEQQDGDLIEVTSEMMTAMQRQRRLEQGRAQSVSELMAQGMSRGRAEKILQARADKDALVRDCLDAGAKVGLYSLRKMKPKELKNMLAELRANP